MVLDTVNDFTVIECEACGFTHVVPIPTPADLHHIYRHEYYATDKPLYIQRQIEDAEWLTVVHADWYAGFERVLPPDRRRLLDVGSGPGVFLQSGRARGWTVRGLEPSSQAAAYSRSLGLDITQAFLTEDVAATLGRFDVVHLSEVLEHVPDPRAMLLLAHQLLEPGGLLALMVPNDYSPFQRALREACGYQPWWVGPPHHLNYFDVDSIQRLVARDFEILSVETSFPIDLFLLMGDNYVGDDERGRVCHARRKTFELNLARAGRGALMHDMYRALSGLGIGRDVILLARKPDRSTP